MGNSPPLKMARAQRPLEAVVPSSFRTPSGGNNLRPVPDRPRRPDDFHMPTISRSHLPQPKDWDEFEEMCADVFGAEWDDRNATRYGRQGQRQDGVDIYGRPSAGGHAGVQCKGRRRWPPRPLKTKDIDEEVAKALKFSPPLTEFTIATTAADDAEIQKHARLITERHAAARLFSVHVVGWDEFVRRFTKHPRLIEKYYPYVSNSSVIDEIRKIPEETVRLVGELTKDGKFVTKAEAAALDVTRSLAEGANAALDRDLAGRLRQAVQRSLFPEAQATDPFSALAQEVLQSGGSAASPGLRRRVLLRASRMAAIRGQINEAEALLAAGTALSGEDSDRPARARLAHAQGRVDEAIKLLRDERDADSVSTLINILSQTKGDDVALQFLQECNVSSEDLTPGGVVALSQIQMRRGALDELNKALDGLTEQQLSEAPYLLFLRGVCRLALVFPKHYRPSVLTAIPIEVSFAEPSMRDPQLTTQLDRAISDLERVYPTTQELDLRMAARVVRWYVVWCKLLHPHRRSAALAQLRSDMQSPTSAVLLVLLALEYDAEFDSVELEAWLQKRDALGGLDEYEFRAALALRIHCGDPKGIAELIAKHRTVCEGSLGKPLALVVEIKALTKLGDAASARLLLEAGRSILEAAIVQQIEAEIATAEGADPVSEHLRIYESTKSLLSLRGLVDALIRKQDHRALGKYAELLYAETGDPEDLVNCAKAFSRAGDHENFIRVMQEHPFLKERDMMLKRALAWRLFDAGNLKEAGQIADELARTESHRDLSLEVVLAIEGGRWERLGLPLGAYLRDQDRYDGLSLIRAANLAQSSGYGPYQELMRAAVRKGQGSAQVLLGAYTVAVEGGLEETKPEAHEWFQRALELSGTDGPIQRFELKELLAHQVAWRDRSRKINDAIVSGDVPLIMAVPALGTTLVDAIVGNFIRSGAQADARKRAAIPIYSGVRPPLAVGEIKRVALDVTSVLVLGWLGLLPQVLDLFPEIVLPSGLLRELFEGRSRIRQFQKSRLVRAQQIKALLASGLKVHRISNTRPDNLAQEIGVDLASFLTAAELNNGIVVRPAPVLRLGLDEQREADMTAHSTRLSDMNTLLKALRDLGAVDQATEAAADKYFRLQDRGWPSSARPDQAKPLYLDDVAVSYLQTTNLLEAVIRAFDAVYIGSDVEEEANDIIEMDLQSAEVLRILDAIRDAIIKPDEAGKIVFGPRTPSAGTDDERDLSTMHLLTDLSRVDAVVFDDRSLNKNPYATDRNGHNARTLTSLDLVEELVRRGVITQAERQSLRHRLRVAGAALVPVDSGELHAAAIRSGSRESAELRAVRESVALAGLREIPRFPAEIPWFLSLNRAVKEALIQVWKSEGTGERAEALADAVLSLQPNALDWLNCWEGSPPPGWIEAANRVMVASLAFPVELTDQAVIGRYHRWLESRVLREIRESDPSRYHAIIGQIRSFILSVAEGKNE